MSGHPHAETHWLPNRSRRRWSGLVHALTAPTGWVLRHTVVGPAARLLAPLLDVGVAPSTRPATPVHH